MSHFTHYSRPTRYADLAALWTGRAPTPTLTSTPRAKIFKATKPTFGRKAKR